MRAAFYTLGCKLNQYETESIADNFKSNGFEIVNIRETADVFVINTCTVTSKSEQKARRIIRKVLINNKDSIIIITGCYAQLEKKEIEELGPNLIVIPQESKSVLHKFAKEIKEGKTDLNYLSCKEDKFSYTPGKYTFHSRAFVKIQDGCNYMCSYCRVPLARGKSVSMDYKLLLKYIKELEKKGYGEAVLTGVNIASYKSGDIDFNLLLKEILGNTHKIRIRISSLEPEKINEQLIEIIKSERICSHFHLPVQSGSDKILKLMRRRYKRIKVIENTELLRKVKPNAFISADIISGFPGESDEDFNLTMDLINECRLSSMHIFRFSRRPGTEAYNMIPVIPERIVTERVKKLSELEKELYLNYVNGCEPFTEAVLEKSLPAEKQDIKTHNVWAGLSDNYLKLNIKKVPLEFKPGQLIKCKILNNQKITEPEERIIAEYCIK